MKEGLESLQSLSGSLMKRVSRHESGQMSGHLAQFWDGRAKDLKEQAGGPIANPGEMAFTHELAVDVLESIPQYQTLFQQSFGEGGINIDRVTEAIAAFEETLVTPDSRLTGGCAGMNRL